MSYISSSNIFKSFFILTVGLFSAVAVAQTTSSSIRGKVVDVSGEVAAGVSVTVTDNRTGAARNLNTNAAGAFIASKLPIGGPYTVSVEGARDIQVESLKLGDVYELSIVIGQLEVTGIEELVVTGSAAASANTAVGPAATFSQLVLEQAVSFNRDIKDVYAFDPRLNIDNPSEGSSLNCAGKHPRFNSVTLDGVRQNDSFGLNSNGYSAATGQPFPYEAIAQVAVELAPFDVTYGGFSACNINAVTKSGSNEWTGSAFYEYTSESFRGDSYETGGEQFDLESDDFNEYNGGFSIGGPIIRDKLFFFAAYETADEPQFLAQGYAGSGNGVERDWLSEANYNRIVNIAQNIYGYDLGEQPSNGSRTQDKVFARLDWNISDQHDLALIYNYYDGIENRASDRDLSEFEFSNHFYDKGSEIDSTTVRLSSQWTDAFSTELSYSLNKIDDSQVTVGNPEFGDFQISIDRDVVYLGADDSRQANDLNTETELLKFNFGYLAGDHFITAGVERETNEVFNLFVQHSRGGEYDFFDDSAFGGLSGIDKFELGLPDRIYYGSGGGTNIAADAGANFEFEQTSVYIQDEFTIDDLDLSIVAGLRYERFDSDDRPRFNQAFATANGFSNDANIDGIDIVMPRIGITWDASDRLQVRGGLGRFSGGNPFVWISNSYSNDGITNVQLRESFDESIFDLPLSGAGRPGFDVPQALVDGVAGVSVDDASDSFLALVDPNYEQPYEDKFALGMTYDFGSDLVVEADLLYSKQKKSAIYRDVSQAQVGQTTAGAPIFDHVVGRNNFMLTNTDRNADSKTLSLILRKGFENGFNIDLGYAFTDAEDVSPMTSSVAGSNFDNLALLDIADPEAGTTNYEVPHRFTIRASFEKEFIKGLATRFTMYGFAKSGQAQSYVMGSQDLEGNGRFGRHLLYVPSGTSDPNVVFADGFQTDEFFAWVNDRGLGQGFVRRNQDNAKSSSRLDLRIDQELPGIFGSEARVYFKMNNLLNFINDSWGVQYDAEFFSQQVVESSVNEAGQYVFESFRDRDVTAVLANSSLWEARIGVELRF